MNENKFSQVIKKLRKEKGLTQQELANIVGITATGVSYWESGNAVPNTETLNKLANYFGVTVNFLLGVKDKIEMEDNSRTAILFRKAEQVDPKEKEILFLSNRAKKIKIRFLQYYSNKFARILTNNRYFNRATYIKWII